jgi:hypothetical protein
MKNTTTNIFYNTELVPTDVIQSPGGNLFEINSYFGEKNIYRLVSLDVKQTSQPLYIIMSKESIISQKWMKVERGAEGESEVKLA